MEQNKNIPLKNTRLISQVYRGQKRAGREYRLLLRRFFSGKIMVPQGYSIRELKETDYEAYVDTLKVLTTVGDIPFEKFKEVLDHWAQLDGTYYPTVIANEKDVVVATGMLLVERKIIHECGAVGHIEDISVAKSEQGKKLGISMIKHLSEVAKNAGCYKVILDCSPHNVGFYEKCGYKNDGSEMCLRL